LVRRGSSFHYRRRVPDALKPILGRSEAWQSLQTDSPKIAARRVHAAAARIEAMFEEAQRIAYGGGKIAIVPEHGPIVVQPCTTKQTFFTSRSISEVYSLYVADPRHNRCHRTLEAYRTTGRWIAEFFGADTSADAITRERCREFLSFLLTVPRHAEKKFPGLSIVEASAMTADRDDVPRITSPNPFDFDLIDDFD
jgi:hypothetical protein